MVSPVHCRPVSATPPGENRIVSLEWDRAHETMTAIVRAESSSGIVISAIHDLTETPGLRWIRANELVDVQDLEPDHPALRLAKLRRSLTRHTTAEPTDLESLLRRLQDATGPIAVYTTRTGSGECLVGYVDTVTSDHLALAEIDAHGTATLETIDFSLGEIIAIDWDNDYLAALDELARSPANGEP